MSYCPILRTNCVRMSCKFYKEDIQECLIIKTMEAIIKPHVVTREKFNEICSSLCVDEEQKPYEIEPVKKQRGKSKNKS